MKKNLQDIDQIFKDALDDHLEPVPPGVWDTVNNDLDKKQAFHYRTKYYRTKRLALLLLLLVFSGIAYQLYMAVPGQKNTGVAQTQLPAAQQSHVPAMAAPGKTPAAVKRLINNETEQADIHTATNEKDAVSGEKTGADTPAESNKNNQADYSASIKEKAGNTMNASGADFVQPREQSVAVKAIRPESINHGQEKAAASQKNNPIRQIGSSITANNKLLRKQGRKESLLTTNRLIADDSSAGDETAGNDDAHAANEQHTANRKTNTPVIQIFDRAELPMAAYLYQPPLFLPVPASPAIDPFTAMPSMHLLSNIAVNNSIPKRKSASGIKPVSKHPVSLVAFASPNHSFRRLENDNQLSGPVLNKKLAEQQEQQVASYSAGLLVNYGISKKFILQSGLVFSSAKTNIAPKTIFARPDNNGHTRYEFNCSSGSSFITPKTGTAPAVGDSIRVMGSSSTLTYIGVPVSLNYVWKKGKFLIKPGIGISVNFLTSGKSATSFGASMGHKTETASINGLKTAYVDGSVGLGAEFMLSRRFSVGIRPLLRMAISAVNKDTPIRTYQNYMSLETGLKINL